MFTQTLVPVGNLGITVLIAFIPLFLMLFLLAGMRMTAWKPNLLTISAWAPDLSSSSGTSSAGMRSR